MKAAQPRRFIDLLSSQIANERKRSVYIHKYILYKIPVTGGRAYINMYKL